MKSRHPPRQERPATSIWQLAGVGLILLGLAGLPACSTVKVRTQPHEIGRESLRSAKGLREMAGATKTVIAAFANTSTGLIREARRLEFQGKETDAAARYLKTALESRGLLAERKEIPGSEAEQALLDVHNLSLARFAELWATDPRRFEDGPHTFTVNDEVFEVEFSLSETSEFSPDFFDRAVATESLRGKGVVEKKRAGYGATLVGIREQRPEREEEMRFFPPRGLFVPITVTLDDPRLIPSGEQKRYRVPVRLWNPELHETVEVGGRAYPLAANFSAPMEMILSGRNELLWGLGGFLEAEKRVDQAGIYLAGPYDPNRIPVLMTHGLVSVPIMWRDVIPELAAEPDLSRRYQFMLFTYPSSFSIAESALLFRTKLAELRQHFDPEGDDPLSTNMVAIGHSMGGVLTHLLVADVGDHLWNQVSAVSIEEFPFNDEQREKARSLAYFEPDPAIQRAIFLSAPHRGAKMAEAGYAGFAASLAHLPSDLVLSASSLFDEGAGEYLKVDLQKKVTSILSLRPDSPIVVGLDMSPYKEGVIYHSIMGDRGKGDTPDSSDGVVDYWSSHQEGAASEIIVPTGHDSYTHPDAIAEIKRILREHAGLPQASTNHPPTISSRFVEVSTGPSTKELDFDWLLGPWPESATAPE